MRRIFTSFLAAIVLLPPAVGRAQETRGGQGGPYPLHAAVLVGGAGAGWVVPAAAVRVGASMAPGDMAWFLEGGALAVWEEHGWNGTRHRYPIYSAAAGIRLTLIESGSSETYGIGGAGLFFDPRHETRNRELDLRPHALFGAGGLIRMRERLELQIEAHARLLRDGRRRAALAYAVAGLRMRL
jgi:hypothetical protein